MPRRPRSRARRARAALPLARTAALTRATIAATEAASAASRTILHRSRYLHDALSDPAAWHHPELRRMGTEKVAAAFAASAAGLGAGKPFQTALSRWTNGQMKLGYDLATGWNPVSPFPALWAAQVRFMQASATLAMSSAADLAWGWTRIVTAAARPVQRVAVANAKRLAALERR